MNNKEYTTEEKERILIDVLSDIAKELGKKEYKQAFRIVKLEFIKDTINDLLNDNSTSLADLLNDNLVLNCKNLKLVMLNGAQSFNKWSYGGCGMVYTYDLQEAFNKPKASGEMLLKLQGYCYYKAYLELSHLIVIKLLNYEKK